MKGTVYFCPELHKASIVYDEEGRSMGRSRSSKDSSLKEFLPQLGKIFLDLLSFVPGSPQPFFAVFLSLLVAVLGVIIATHWLEPQWVGIVKLFAIVLSCLLVVSFLGLLVRLFFPVSTPAASAGTISPGLTIAEKAMAQALLNLLEGRVAGTKAAYLPQKLGVPKDQLVAFFEKLLQ
jgi:hypothetical protein